MRQKERKAPQTFCLSLKPPSPARPGNACLSEHRRSAANLPTSSRLQSTPRPPNTHAQHCPNIRCHTTPGLARFRAPHLCQTVTQKTLSSTERGSGEGGGGAPSTGRTANTCDATHVTFTGWPCSEATAWKRSSICFASCGPCTTPPTAAASAHVPCCIALQSSACSSSWASPQGTSYRAKSIVGRVSGSDHGARGTGWASTHCPGPPQRQDNHASKPHTTVAPATAQSSRSCTHADRAWRSAQLAVRACLTEAPHRGSPAFSLNSSLKAPHQG